MCEWAHKHRLQQYWVQQREVTRPVDTTRSRPTVRAEAFREPLRPVRRAVPGPVEGGGSPPVDLLGIKATQLYAPQARTSSRSQGRGRRHRTYPLCRIEPVGVWLSIQNPCDSSKREPHI